jgi:D-glycero-alpha-D-manno-heptose-7-phosphate kinase
MIEQERIQEHVGSQDQFHAAFGGFNVIEFHENQIKIRPVIALPKKIDAIERHLLLFYTWLTRHASEILQEQVARTKNLLNDDYLRQMADQVDQAEAIIAEEAEDIMIQKLGQLLDANWKFKKLLSSKISNSMIDEAYETAKKAGAFGGKLCGAGSGGFLALLAPIEKHEAIKKALPNLIAVPVHFENSGSTIIYMKE